MSVVDLGVLLGVMALAGAFAGLIAGLFGVGGGTVMVPALFYAFETLGVGGEGNLHTAIGSSLAVIIATSIRSLSAHRRHHAVDEDILRTWTPWIALGGLLGAVAAAFISSGGLGLVYMVIAIGVAAQLGLMPRHWVISREMPTGAVRAVVGSGVGLASALMGVGGGALGGMVMTLCNRPIHTAVATASGFGLAIGVPATLGFIVAGWDQAGRPPLSLGYVNLPAVLVMGALTVLVAPYGARLAHRMDQLTLRRCFAVFLFATAISVGLKAL
jgi:uncharacterized membrane protein YfcA